MTRCTHTLHLNVAGFWFAVDSFDVAPNSVDRIRNAYEHMACLLNDAGVLHTPKEAHHPKATKEEVHIRRHWNNSSISSSSSSNSNSTAVGIPTHIIRKSKRNGSKAKRLQLHRITARIEWWNRTKRHMKMFEQYIQGKRCEPNRLNRGVCRHEGYCQCNWLEIDQKRPLYYVAKRGFCFYTRLFVCTNSHWYELLSRSWKMKEYKPSGRAY